MKLPLDHTDDDISINMGSGRKGGGSKRYNKYNKQSSNIPTTIPKDDEKPCEHVPTVFNTHEWAKVTKEDGKELGVQQVQQVHQVQVQQVQQVQKVQQVQQVQKVQVPQVQQAQQVQPQRPHNNHKDNEIANTTTTLIWLMDLWRPYCRNKGTFRLAREFMDNFLRVTPQVPTDKLQLVGITCLYMSCRALESSWRPFELLETLTDLTDDAVTPEEV